MVILLNNTFFLTKNLILFLSFLLLSFIRHQFTKRQRIVHTYGNEDDGDDLDEDVALGTVLQNTAGTEVNVTAGPSRANSKTSVCGGTDHLRRSACYAH